MKTVSVINAKGGVYKSGLCIQLAVMAESRGLTTVILDTDGQASSSRWGDLREADTPVVTSIQPSRLRQAMAVAEESGAKLTIIDTPPHSSDTAIQAAELADIVLVPCRAGILDLMALATTARIIKIADAKAFVILNAMPHRAPRFLADAQEAVAVHGLDLAPHVLHQRSAYSHSLAAGQGVGEYDPSCKGASEIASLFDWLLMMLA
jgi:chromosome partitioning protein